MVFGIMCRYWSGLVTDLYQTQQRSTGPGGLTAHSPLPLLSLSRSFSIQLELICHLIMCVCVCVCAGLRIGQLAQQQRMPRLQQYNKILQRLRYVMIEQMPKPEEVIIVEDEYGQVFISLFVLESEGAKGILCMRWGECNCF